MPLQNPDDTINGPLAIAVILLGVCIAIVTWSQLADAASLPLWRTYTGVGVTLLCALAALTRHPYRAAATRLLMGAWTPV